jgi:CRISPR-associated protein Csb2
MLTITCEYLAPAVFARAIGIDDAAEWPPHPARLFSALAAGWGDGGERVEEREALLALERLPPPEVVATGAPGRRDTVTVYVPVNDAASRGRGVEPAPGGIAVLPDRRPRKPRTFPAVVVTGADSVVRYEWPAIVWPDDRVDVLQAIAQRVGYLGHSTALVRVHVSDSRAGEAATAERLRPDAAGGRSLRWVAPGRLDHLTEAYASRRRPDVGITFGYRVAGDDSASAPRSALAGEVVVLRAAGCQAPSLEAWAYVAWVLRRALIAVIDRELRGELSEAERQSVLSSVSGHEPGGTPLQAPHCAFLPLANVGWNHRSPGALVGAAILVPGAGRHSLVVEAIGAAIERGAVERPDADTNDGRVFSLVLGKLGEWWLAPVGESPLQSLKPHRYLASARRWTSVTPVVLDRFPKQDGDVEAGIASACEHIGLPHPQKVTVHKHAGVHGAPPSRPRVPHGPGSWLLSWNDENGAPAARFRQRPLTHATITFDRPVRGPVILGAGRYHGLGLFLPSPKEAAGE